MAQGSDDYQTDSREGSAPDEFDALQAVIGALRPLSSEARYRILDSAATFLGIGFSAKPEKSQASEPGSRPVPTAERSPYSEDTSMLPKDFLLEKEPKTDVERIACLAYYMTHYRATPHFKTVDLSLLNTEAAQPKFSNTTVSANNAVKMGYLVPSSRGLRQLSAIGERFVRALPDREAAKMVMTALRRRRSKRKTASAESTDEE